jgi:hypothetical protein
MTGRCIRGCRQEKLREGRKPKGRFYRKLGTIGLVGSRSSHLKSCGCRMCSRVLLLGASSISNPLESCGT